MILDVTTDYPIFNIVQHAKTFAKMFIDIFATSLQMF